jgi:indolepyruvate ferredoxin oxidoreductase
LEVARVPETIKGFGHVKERNIRAARALWASLAER